MTSYSALGPVSDAVFAALNVAGLTDIATGGVYDHIPQATTFPCVRYTVESDPLKSSGLGTEPGSGQLSEIDIRVHAYDTYEGANYRHQIIDKVAELLKRAPSVSLHDSWSIFFDRTAEIENGDVIGGVRVSESVGFFRLYVEQTG